MVLKFQTHDHHIYALYIARARAVYLIYFNKMKPKSFTCESVSFFPVLERDFYQNEDGFSVDFKAITSREF